MTSLSVRARLNAYDRLERLWTDDRFTNGHSRPAVREFIEAYWWAKITNPDDWWAEMHRRTRNTATVMGRNWWARSIYREDAPRWDADQPATYGCGVVLPRAGRPCGRSGSTSRVTDPQTGEWQVVTRCRSHGGHNAPEFVAERHLDRSRIPEPHPNRGGLLPSYIASTSWPDLYAVSRPGWKPPSVGIVADDWPVMVRVIGEPMPKMSKADLRLIPGGAA